MIFKNMNVENFRLLKDFNIEFKDELSLVIGKNNCGKTSVITILDKMLNSSKQSKLMWEDVNLEWQKELHNKILEFNMNEQKDIKYLEAIKLKLFIEYNDGDSYTNIQKFMMDLNPQNNIIVLEFVSLISVKKIVNLKKIISEKNIEDFESFSKFMSKNFSNFFEMKKYSRGFDVESEKIRSDISEEIDNEDIKKVIKLTGIRADRAVSNDERNHVLSGLTAKYFSSYKSASNESQSNGVFSELEKKVEEADKALYEIYNGGKNEGGEIKEGIFSNIIKTIKTYGVSENEIDIVIESVISEKNLLSDNTNLSYKQGKDCSLPETYNGLGYLNLIGILFEIETKMQELFENPADINLLYIEEPEAHTHPQLQYIFIRNIKSHIETHRNKFVENNKKLQLLITSHSSHIVSECNFDDIIYLKKDGNVVTAKNFNSLEEEYGGDKFEGFKFVKQYLTLSRSELFFADKVICVEGNTERILIPMMMYKIDNEEDSKNNNVIPLLSQNISIVEVGGTHIYNFIHLFEFLGIKVLIITDIDSCRKNKEGKYVKCNPKDAEGTTNKTIKKFFGYDNGKKNIPENYFKEILEKKTEDKIKNNMRIAYQIPENDNEYQARSFEDAFIALNKDFILNNKEKFYNYGALKNFKGNDISDCYNFSLKNIEKKSLFAISLLYFGSEEWRVPRYIKEGLLWIR